MEAISQQVVLFVRADELVLVRFAIEPAVADDPKDRCSTHSREAFRDLVKFLNLTLFVDFPNDASNCHDIDPQKARPAKAEVDWTAPLEREAAPGISSASGIPRYLIATLYLFHGGTGACTAPILFLTTTP